jgi:hypothetical protein
MEYHGDKIYNDSCNVDNVYYSSYDSNGSNDILKQSNTDLYCEEEDNANERILMNIQVVSYIFLSLSSISLIFMLAIIMKLWKTFDKIIRNADEEEVSGSTTADLGEEKPNEKKSSWYREDDMSNIRMGVNVPSLIFGFGDNNYKKACRLSEMTIDLLNEYMNDWYKKVSQGSDEINKWHPYLLTNDIELSGYIMVRIMNSRLENMTKGMIEYISVIISSAVFHGLLKGSKQVMNDINQLYKIRLPSNCVSVYKIKRIRSYGENQLLQAYTNHKITVRVTADEKANVVHFDKQIEEDKVRMYNDEMKKLVLKVLSEIEWNKVLNKLVSIYSGYNEEDTESDYCVSPRHDSEEYRRSHL